MKKLIFTKNKYQTVEKCKILKQAKCLFILAYRPLFFLVILALLTNTATLNAQLCASSGNDQTYEWMNRFQLNGVSTPTYGVGGYFDYSASSMTTLNAGTAYPMQADVYTDGTTYDEYVIIWLDMNQDGVIDDATERVYTNNANVTTFLMFTGNISAVPVTAHNGDMIGRVIMQFSAAPSLCGTYQYGTTIDFKVTITGATTYYPLTITKSGSGTGNVTNNPTGTSFLPGTSVTLTATATGSSAFNGWSGDASGTANPLTITMDAAKNITATFIALSAPTVSTTTVSSIGLTTASSGGNVTSDGGSTVTSRGVCWNTTGAPTIAGSKTSDGSGTGSFTSSITGLALGTTYHVRAYATNTSGTGYGSELSFTTLKNSQNITFNALTAITYGNADFDPGATASSSLTITYSSSNTAIATIVINQVHIVGAGAVTIYADQAGNGIYYAAPQVSQSLTVNAKAITVTGASADNKIYDGNLTATISGGSLVGIVGADEVTLATATSGTFASASVGTGKTVTPSMTLTGAAAGNYSIIQPTLSANITAKALTVTGATADNKIYDGALTATISGGSLVGIVGADIVTLATATSGTFASAALGIGKTVTSSMTLTGAASGNYSITQPTLTANITAKALTITGATAANKVYDGSTAASISGGSLVGIVGTDIVTLANATSGTFASADVGTGKTVTSSMTLTGAAVGNYNIVQPTLAADITTKAITITGASAANKVYDGTLAAVISGGLLVGAIGVDDVTLATATSGTFASATVGTGKTVTSTMTLTGTAAGNYSLTQPTLIADITSKELTVTSAIAANKVYDGTTNAVISGATLTGVVDSDDVTLETDTIGTFASANAGLAIVVTPEMTLAGADIDNYTLTQPTLSGGITAKELTVIDALAANKVYDGTTNATISGATLIGVIGSDDVRLATNTTGTFAFESIGTAFDVTPAMTITGAAIGNYTLTQPTLTADITAKELTVTGAIAANKVYDGNTAAVISGATLSGVIGSEDVTLDNDTIGTFATASSGTNISVTSAMTITGTDIGNYTLTQPTLTADIIGIELTVEDALVSNKVYDGTTDAFITGATLVGVLGLDDVTLENDTGGIFTSANLGTGIGVTTAMSLSGVDAGKYKMEQPSLTADITARPIEITAISGQKKEEGEADPVFEYIITSGSLVAADALSGLLSRTSGETAGNYPIQIGTLSAGDNYSISFVTADFVITHATGIENSIVNKVDIFQIPQMEFLISLQVKGK